ncbi:MAG: DUF4886 domain-containing protein [Pirellulales bacterium]
MPTCSVSFKCCRRGILSLAVGLFTLQFAASATAADAKPVRLLTVGNSFSADAMTYFEELAEAGGQKLILRQVVLGGSSMAKHLELATAHEKNPKDGLYGNKRSLKENLLMDKWDIITIQQRSLDSPKLDTYRPAAADLVKYIRKYAPQAEIVLHETWAYRKDDPMFQTSKPKPGDPRTQRAMYDGLKNAYDTIGKELGLRIIPVGDAFIAADEDAKWGYVPAAKPKIEYPTPPEQPHSLHVGWKWSKAGGKDVLGMDGHHASMAGRYLAGCVFYEFLFGVSPVGNSYVPPKLDADYARFLQETAHTAVQKRLGAR